MNSFDDALQNGWTEVCHDDGVSWNSLGLCPECVNYEIEEAADMQSKGEEEREFPS